MTGGKKGEAEYRRAHFDLRLSMHPYTFKSTLFDFEKRDEIFVIISFASEFNRRWEEVIEPAIRDDLRLKPNRVDYNDSGESIVRDILDGIANARLVLADITSSRMTDRRGQEWPQRNGNVMWELGIAHVMRMPDEVIVVRSDDDPSPFDLTQFRAFQYDPSDIIEARRIIVDLALDRLRVIDQTRSDFVQRCAAALDAAAMSTFLNSVPMNGDFVRVLPSMGNAITWPKLFEMGLVRGIPALGSVDASGKTGFITPARITPLGLAVMEKLRADLDIRDLFVKQK